MKQYPLVLVTDADYTFQLISGVTQAPMHFGKMEEVILVGLSYSKNSGAQNSRIRDFTPSTNTDWEYITGEAPYHATFIKNTILPYAEKSYRLSERGHTFVGNSLGGLFGAYLLLSHPGSFDNYILGSPSVWYDKEMILKLKAKSSTKLRKVFIAVGAFENPINSNTHNDMVAGALKLYNKLKTEKGIEVDTKLLIIPEANHGTAFPTTAIQGLDWIYKTNK
ncbi:alpha/beta hydrolase-fold protein [Microbulbifer sp. OS29]|uniref:Alpha/beta hydrolase-fold protein n=1 Tax=Microbulbifer okhotskensis TaxID=2926617 RepID=A0A9X2ESW0_9GAMM|nr:alpha/beta hydrolase-fold protein [Microbulbifer okhotskensis]